MPVEVVAAVDARAGGSLAVRLVGAAGAAGVAAGRAFTAAALDDAFGFVATDLVAAAVDRTALAADFGWDRLDEPCSSAAAADVAGIVALAGACMGALSARREVLAAAFLDVLVELISKTRPTCSASSSATSADPALLEVPAEAAAVRAAGLRVVRGGADKVPVLTLGVAVVAAIATAAKRAWTPRSND